MSIYRAILAAFFSSIILSMTVNLFLTGEGDVSTPMFLFAFPVYLFLGIPLSIFIARARHRQKWWQSFSYYTLISLGLSGVVMVTSSLERGEELMVTAFIIGCAWMYFLVYTILSHVRNLGLKGS
ncbi:hypothetical protein [Halobacillus sp. Nhm2S1]|uniref:hypothetical protein n=1 Tax=Halobacillus sp. Nhm2S1 TaxID=2866716 RepID=UPI001C739A1E|nr:hypothetical protein [Halobacillus sp. Nhm2S1]MBX0357022.1 hypothetical protein [Halobacillus sp. Nhm2S1]